MNVIMFFTQVATKPDQQKKFTRTLKTYDDKLAEGDYSSFTSRDVVEHFDRYYKKANGRAKVYNKDNAVTIVEELYRMGFTSDDLTLYIEFIFESDQTKIDKEKCGLGTFKYETYVQYIEDNLDDFENGKSISQKEKAETRKHNIDKHKEWSRENTGRIAFELPSYF